MKNDNKLAILFLMFCCLSKVDGQNVGINTPSPKTSLDIKGGITVQPKQWLLDADNITLPNNESNIILKPGAYSGIFSGSITTPNAGQRLIIDNQTGYNGVMGSDAIIQKGLNEYIYSDGLWKTVAVNSWGIDGNYGTEPATNFIGTTDKNDVVFKRYNDEKMRIKEGGIEMANEIQPNGVAGAAGQVLTNNGNGTMAWNDQCEYKNFKVFNYTTPNAVQTFTVPIGVTKVKAKLWGGGGNGATNFAPNFASAGGAGGGYAEAVFLNATTLDVKVAQGATNSLVYSEVLFPGTIAYIRAFNGESSIISGGFLSLGRGGGALLSILDPSFIKNYIGMQGKSGTMDTKNYYQISATAYGMLMITGMGGDAANTANTGAQSGRVNYNITAGTYYTPSYSGSPGLLPGGGGASGGGSDGGANGMVILYW